ncbi:MAG: histidine kinase [Bryobacterales bacterium]|nr:histidine kinase [Bryobacterales bacterium]
MDSTCSPIKRTRHGLRFVLLAALVGPPLASLLMWSVTDFELPFAAVLHSYFITTVHFLCYGAVFYPAIAWHRSRTPLPVVARAAGYVILAAIGSVFAIGVSRWIGLNTSEDFLTSLTHSLVVGLILCSIVLLVEYLWHRQMQAREESRIRALDQERARRSAAEARWSSLESRLRPHFLFNTLTSIRELMHQDVAQADEILQRFAELLRFSLDANRAVTVPLEEEMRMVSAYLAIEKTRLGSRLNWEQRVAAGTEMASIPSLSILTLAENAIKHSISARRAGGRVAIYAHDEGGAVVVRVEDDGSGFKESALLPGHGLDLLRERLTLLYGAPATLSIRPRTPGVAVEFRVPLTHQEPPTDATPSAMLRS